jgi:hypothetical protein
MDFLSFDSGVFFPAGNFDIARIFYLPPERTVATLPSATKQPKTFMLDPILASLSATIRSSPLKSIGPSSEMICLEICPHGVIRCTRFYASDARILRGIKQTTRRPPNFHARYLEPKPPGGTRKNDTTPHFDELALRELCKFGD